MNRKDILVALAREKKLTPLRQSQVRCLSEDFIKRQMATWELSDSTLALAGLIRIPGKTKERKATNKDVEEAVQLHLILLGFEPVPLKWVSWRVGERMELNSTWQAPLVGYAVYHGLPTRVAQIVAKMGEDSWTPLIELIPNGVLPFGLSTDGEFLVAEAAELYGTEI